MAGIRIKRGTRAQIDAAALAGTLAVGEPYLITDEGRIAVASGTSAYQVYAKYADMGVAPDGFSFPGIMAAYPGLWVPLGHVVTGSNGSLGPLDCDTYSRFQVCHPVTLTGLSIDVATAFAGGVFDVGIYDSDAIGNPSSLLVQVTNLSTSTTGVKAGAISLRLNPGNYWAASVSREAYGASVRVLTASGSSSMGREGSNVRAFMKSDSTSLPATALPPGAAYSLTNLIPAISARYTS